LHWAVGRGWIPPARYQRGKKDRSLGDRAGCHRRYLALGR